MDDVEQRSGLGGLVRLQLADEVEADIGRCSDQRRPFALCLGDAVFTEAPVPGRNEGGDRCNIEGLADRDEFDAAWVSPDTAGRAGKPAGHGVQPLGGIGGVVVVQDQNAILVPR